MRRIVTFLAAISLSLGMSAQEATTTWPYLYPDFVQGTVYMNGGAKHVQMMNVHLAHSDLHFLDKDVVRKAVLEDVLVIELGRDSFISRDGSVYKVLNRVGQSVLAVQYTGDFASLAESSGAYGTSTTTAATRNVSSLYSDTTLGSTHKLLFDTKHDGQELSVITKFYIITPEVTCEASRQELDRLFADRQGEWKAWQKSAKIKWRDSESLVKILQFIEQQ